MTVQNQPIDLQGQVALVTGGGRGLGRAYAQALAQAGAAVAITSRTEAELHEVAHLIEQRSGRALSITADVSNPEATRQMVATVTQLFGPIDLLVNNAGSLRAFGSVAEVEADLWWRDLEINLRGPFLCSQAVLPSMIARRRGRVINLASSAGLGPILNGTSYCLGKAALIRMSEIMALETQPHGITVFAIDPGTVRTPMTDYLINSESASQHIPHIQTWMRQMIAEGQDVPIERSTELVLRLASGEADALSGCMISVHDDLAALVQHAEQVNQEELHKLRLHTWVAQTTV